ncbi:hypothetical protein KQI63_15790 [bacterium]|nr:hypothetical protein [bacterium]
MSMGIPDARNVKTKPIDIGLRAGNDRLERTRLGKQAGPPIEVTDGGTG